LKKIVENCPENAQNHLRKHSPDGKHTNHPHVTLIDDFAERSRLSLSKNKLFINKINTTQKQRNTKNLLETAQKKQA
jgi:hypothetical protein